MSETSKCESCGRAVHGYSTSGCVNVLLAENERLRARLRGLAEDVAYYADRQFLVKDAEAILADLGASLTTPPEYELWEVYDARTGRAASQSGFRSRESAERKITFWVERQKKGGRPDIGAEDVAALRVRRAT